jgi:hypothetical protein
VSASARRILFFPLSNVLGHLSRTLALAEEFDARGHEVHVALDGSYGHLTPALPPSIRIHSTPEMDPEATREFGPILSYEDNTAAHRVNLESADRLDAAELRRRGQRLVEMVERDTAIVEDVHPDAVITDYRYTVERLRCARPKHVFHISHLLGYPSLYQRLRGTRFPPLDKGQLLVPGIAAIETARTLASASSSHVEESLCGPFRWRGWARLSRARALPPPADVFLCFGSTGRAERIVPALQQTLGARYRISAIPAEMADLECYLSRTEVAFCHGGHGTVLECILQRTPMAIFPQNIEQLEIGHAIEALGLGVLVKQPYERLSGAQLGALVERLKTDGSMQHRLQKFSELLREQNGPARAASIVLDQL